MTTNEEAIFLLYEKGVITKTEAFSQFYDLKLNPPDEWKEEYEKWIIVNHVKGIFDV